ncbi:MAG: hypothetical protein [Bacteriophage sp.]|nr:MAG: hypothetical protein [Bacteriophage sp.]
MADQNITALPVATAPASSDQILLVGAEEEKLIDYDKLADAILNKLTSKNFSLDQGTMPLVSALNQLNSKTSKLALKENVTNIQALISKASSGTCILFHLSGTNYAGNDLPIGEKYKYGSGIIFYRNSNSCKIVLFPEEMKPVWKMANWAKWKDFANNIVD